MKKQFLVLVLIILLSSFYIPNQAVFHTEKADCILKVEVLDIYPGATWDWGSTEYPLVCKPLQIYKDSLPYPTSIIGFNLPVKDDLKKIGKGDTVGNADKFPVKIGQQYILFISTKNPGSINYMKENKSYPLFFPSGETEECVFPFSKEIETQIIESIKK